MPEREERESFEVRFADETKKEFRKLGPSARAEILAAVQKKLTEKPNEYGDGSQREAKRRERPAG